METIGDRALIIIPTYNEAENIGPLVEEIFRLVPPIHVLIIDDNSPDGTAERVRALQHKWPQLKLVMRGSKQGLATAYLAGFEYAFEGGYKYIFEMDADRSHDPQKIPEFLTAIRDCDLVIGSRYVRGGRVERWSATRFFLSWFANKYARLITGMPVHDATVGFKCFRRHVLEAINLQTIRSRGYAFQIEVNHRAWRRGFRIREIPITFTDRTLGKSKMSRGIIWEALWSVWKLRFLH